MGVETKIRSIKEHELPQTRVGSVTTWVRLDEVTELSVEINGFCVQKIKSPTSTKLENIDTSKLERVQNIKYQRVRYKN